MTLFNYTTQLGSRDIPGANPKMMVVPVVAAAAPEARLILDGAANAAKCVEHVWMAEEVHPPDYVQL